MALDAVYTYFYENDLDESLEIRKFVSESQVFNNARTQANVPLQLFPILG